MATLTAAAVICLLEVIFVSGVATTSEGRWYERQLQVLRDVISGPAQRRPLALHLEAALSADVWQEILAVEAPHLTLILGLNQSQGELPPLEVAAALLPHESSSSFSSMLHVVLWVTPRPEILHALWLIWKPRNLLFFNLGSSPGTYVLRNEALNGVEKLALIGHLSSEADRGLDALGVYTMLPFSPDGVKLLGQWHQESFSSWEVLFPDRFPSFEGYTFSLAPYVDYPPFIYRPFVEKSAAATKKYGRGVAIQVFEAISKKLNYTYTITEMVGKWGAIENGSWVGILGTMARKEKNFSISGFYINEERLSGFDPSVTVGSESSSVFVPSPKPLPEWLSIIRPFSPTAWASFVAAVIISVLAMAFFEGAMGGCCRSLSPGKVTALWQDLPRALVAQSFPILPKLLWQRVFVAVWLLGCLVATAAYTCNLVGIFTSITYPRRLRTLQDLADSNYRLALLDNGGYTMRLVLYSEGQMYQKMRDKVDWYASIDDAVMALKAGQHAIVAIESSSRFSVMRQMKTLSDEKDLLLGSMASVHIAGVSADGLCKREASTVS